MAPAPPFLAGALGASAFGALTLLYGLWAPRLDAELPMTAMAWALGSAFFLAAWAVGRRSSAEPPATPAAWVAGAGFTAMFAFALAGWVAADLAFPDEDLLPLRDPLGWTFNLAGKLIAWIAAWTEYARLRRRWRLPEPHHPR